MTAATLKILMILLITVGILSHCGESAVTCRDDKGKEVDWYILYKLPQQTSDGLSYMYMDRNTNGWRLSPWKINSGSGALGGTLKPLLDFYIRRTEDFGYLLYSDQPPPPAKGVSDSYGHSKGIVMLDRQTGVWLSHSTPRFPTYRNQNFWPSNGAVNAQTFLCVTYDYSQFKEIGLQLKYIHPKTYDYDIPKTFPTELHDITEGYPRKAPFYRMKELTSRGGQYFLSVGKYGRFGDDLYSGLISSELKQSLYVQTYPTAKSPRLPSNCSIPYPVYNVLGVAFGENSFTNTVDHSKWCVSCTDYWTCIADLNRHVSQASRGGGAICINNINVRNAFYDLIRYTEQCQHREL